MTGPEPRQLAVIRGADGYDGLVRAIREHIASLGTTYKSIDHLALQPEGYTQKLLGPSQVKVFGRHSLGPILSAAGLQLIVAIDPEALAHAVPRLDKRRIAKSEPRAWRWRLIEHLREAGIKGAIGYVNNVPPEVRRRIARKAAGQRWRHKRRGKMRGCRA